MEEFAQRYEYSDTEEEPWKETRKEVEAETGITWRLGVGKERIHIKTEPAVLSCGELPECSLENTPISGQIVDFFVSCVSIKHDNIMGIINSVRKFNLYTLTNGISGVLYIQKGFGWIFT